MRATGIVGPDRVPARRPVLAAAHVIGDAVKQGLGEWGRAGFEPHGKLVGSWCSKASSRKARQSSARPRTRRPRHASHQGSELPARGRTLASSKPQPVHVNWKPTILNP